MICGGLVSATAIAETGEQSKSTYKTKVVEEVVVQGRYVVNDRLDTATGLGLTLQETPQSFSIMTFQRIEDQDLR